VFRTVVPLTLALAIQACAIELDRDGRAPGAVAEPYIAVGRDFEDFMTWDVYEIPDTGLRSGHGSLPPSFLYLRGVRDVPFGEPLPVGTTIVRTRELGTPTEWTVHAMVKRGGGYNPDGATGWEWFDLALDPSGRPFITWRGAGDAADPGSYGPDVDGHPIGCNDCHALLPGNDFVFTRGLISE
jgi:hypothetical protein